MLTSLGSMQVMILTVDGDDTPQKRYQLPYLDLISKAHAPQSWPCQTYMSTMTTSSTSSGLLNLNIDSS